MHKILNLKLIGLLGVYENNPNVEHRENNLTFICLSRYSRTTMTVPMPCRLNTMGTIIGASQVSRHCSVIKKKRSFNSKYSQLFPIYKILTYIYFPNNYPDSPKFHVSPDDVHQFHLMEMSNFVQMLKLNKQQPQ